MFSIRMVKGVLEQKFYELKQTGGANKKTKTKRMLEFKLY